LILLGNWGTSGPGDIDGDGIVGVKDLLILLGSWGPLGSECEFIEVCTAEDLDNVRNDLDGNYLQVCDIDLEGYDDFRPIPPIFTGIYDGDGYTIFNFNYFIPLDDYVGLFRVSNGTIKNVRLENANITGKRFMGLLASVNNGSILNSFVSGQVQDTNDVVYATGGVGGLVGIASENSTIMNSRSEGNVIGSISVGGLVGHKEVGAIIINSSSSAIVQGGISGGIGGLIGRSFDYLISHEPTVIDSYAKGNVIGDTFAGGLIGIHHDGTVQNSFATGNVSSSNWSAGGLIGIELRGNVINSFATGDVFGDWRSGGLIGWLHDPSPLDYNSSLANCYATGKVSGSPIAAVGGLVGLTSNDRVDIINCYSIGEVSVEEGGVTGGLVGYNQNFETDVINSYWDIETSGQNESAGGEGRTTEEMINYANNTYVNWDFESIWQALENNYPWLQWQGSPD